MLGFCSELGAIVFVGLVIKLMDDYLDFADDSVALVHLSRGVVPYSLLLMLTALAIDFSLSSALFLGAYAVGMFGRSSGNKNVLPTNLSAKGESLVALIAGILMAGWHKMSAATIIIVAVQAIDDLVDYSEDKKCGVPSWVTRYGLVQIGLVLVITMALGLLLSPRILVEVIIVSRLISTLFDRANHSVEGEMDG